MIFKLSEMAAKPSYTHYEYSMIDRLNMFKLKLKDRVDKKDIGGLRSELVDFKEALFKDMSNNEFFDKERVKYFYKDYLNAVDSIIPQKVISKDSKLNNLIDDIRNKIGKSIKSGKKVNESYEDDMYNDAYQEIRDCYSDGVINEEEAFDKLIKLGWNEQDALDEMQVWEKPYLSDDSYYDEEY